MWNASFILIVTTSHWWVHSIIQTHNWLMCSGGKTFDWVLCVGVQISIYFSSKEEGRHFWQKKITGRMHWKEKCPSPKRHRFFFFFFLLAFWDHENEFVRWSHLNYYFTLIIFVFKIRLPLKISGKKSSWKKTTVQAWSGQDMVQPSVRIHPVFLAFLQNDRMVFDC